MTFLLHDDVMVAKDQTLKHRWSIGSAIVLFRKTRRNEEPKAPERLRQSSIKARCQMTIHKPCVMFSAAKEEEKEPSYSCLLTSQIFYKP